MGKLIYYVESGCTFPDAFNETNQIALKTRHPVEMEFNYIKLIVTGCDTLESITQEYETNL